MKGLICDIYKSHKSHNSGKQLSANAEGVTVIDLKQKGVFEPSINRPAVLLYRRICMGENMPIMVPCRFDKNGTMEVLTGTMFGGNYVSCSDSRFHSSYPIPLHDRTEGGENWVNADLWLAHPHNRQYEKLSLKHSQ